MRGARQVGKSYLAGDLAQRRFETLAERNFEETQQAALYFEEKSPDKIIRKL